MRSFFYFWLLFFGAPIKCSKKDVVFIEEKKIEHNFSEFYENNLRPIFLKYETLRQKKLNKCIKNSRLAFAVILAICFGSYYFYPYLVTLKSIMLSRKNSAYDFLNFFLFLVCCFFVAMACEPYFSFKEKIKSEIFIKFFGFFSNLSYCPKGSSNHGYKKFNILPKYTYVKSEDTITGNHQGVDLKFEEISLIRRRRIWLNRHKDYEKEVFRGFVVLLSANKNFKSKTIVKCDLGKIGNHFISKNKYLKKVELEDIQFEKEFEVYSGNQIEARYLITTSFMRRCLDLAQFFGSEKFEISFFKNQVLIAVKNKINLFEPRSIFQEMDLVKESKNLMEQLEIIFSTIEILKFNQKIGL